MLDDGVGKLRSRSRTGVIDAQTTVLGQILSDSVLEVSFCLTSQSQTRGGRRSRETMSTAVGDQMVELAR